MPLPFFGYAVPAQALSSVMRSLSMVELSHDKTDPNPLAGRPCSTLSGSGVSFAIGRTLIVDGGYTEELAVWRAVGRLWKL
jgi:hypothetical protein